MTNDEHCLCGCALASWVLAGPSTVPPAVPEPDDPIHDLFGRETPQVTR